MVRILNGAALRTADRKALADAAVLCCLMAMNTQRVALSMSTKHSRACPLPASGAGTSHLCVIYVQVARLVGFAGLVFAIWLELHGQSGVASSAQPLSAQIDDQLLLRRVERGLQAMRRMAGVLYDAAMAPLAHGVHANSVLLGQFAASTLRLLQCQACDLCCHGVFVQGNQHARPFAEACHVARTAWSKGHLFLRRQ